MQIKVNNKLIMICLLLCFLLLTSSISILDANGVIFPPSCQSDIFNASGTSGSSSSMSGGMNLATHEYMAAACSSAEFSVSSSNQSRFFNAKTNYDILTLIVPVQLTSLAAYLRFSEHTYTRLFSSIITVILQKKDGMK